MHLATTLNRTVGRRLKLSIAMFAMLLCASMGLAMGTAASASAAGPDYLNAGQSVNYPTWGWGSTRVCAQNLSSRAGMADVTPHWSSPPGQHERHRVQGPARLVPAFTRREPARGPDPTRQSSGASPRRASYADDLHGGKSAEIRVLSQHGDAVAHRRSGNPRVMPSWLAPDA